MPKRFAKNCAGGNSPSRTLRRKASFAACLSFSTYARVRV